MKQTAIGILAAVIVIATISCSIDAAHYLYRSLLVLGKYLGIGEPASTSRATSLTIGAFVLFWARSIYSMMKKDE